MLHLTGGSVRGGKKRRKRLVKYSESISTLCGVCIDREILTSDHHQTMETGTKKRTRFSGSYQNLLTIPAFHNKPDN